MESYRLIFEGGRDDAWRLWEGDEAALTLTAPDGRVLIQVPR